jgi:tRNA A37 threonylcarbamoyladenosine dehydratase
VIDAVDSLKDKVLLILNASASKARFFCSLGAALKVDPRRIKVAEFWEVRGCPLGAAIRKKMKRAGTLPAKKFLCVFDDEVLPNRGTEGIVETDTFNKAQINGTTAHITALFGFTLAGLVIQDLYRKA